ncbi:oligosaccharide flippase family protein [Salinicola corii]|uniref:Oligosaccharide flippase family protein n=1 Tax=Salinicola corii TaxID=2606937 RepID=A0A640WD28_9GAMM|nr:oligosaccharide flippase family protein [Salinicola corii]KAA0017930.1 oligosaccharide flippase family protein [Salinicola corii]
MSSSGRVGMQQPFFRRFRGELFLSLCKTFVARGIAALGTLFLGLVLGRLYGADGVGVFALAQSVILGAGIIARFGLNGTLMRYVSQDNDSPNIPVYLRWSVVRSGGLSITIGVLVWLSRDWVAIFFGSLALADVLASIALAIPAFTLSFVLAGFLKGVGMPARASLQENGSISLLAAACILALFWTTESHSLSQAGWGFCLAAWLVGGQGAIQTWLWLRRHPLVTSVGADESTLPSRETYFSTAHSFIVLNVSQFLQQVLSVMIAGALLSHADLGLFKSAERVALMISFILLVINAVFPPRFARLFHQGKHTQLKRLAQQSSMVATVLALPPAAICFLFPEWVLGWFGDEFRQAANLLRIIAIGQLINVTTGAVGFLLTMTGREKVMRNISLACSTLGTVSFFVLIPVFGATGAALSLMLVLVLQNVVAALVVWRKMDIVMLPWPVKL